MNLHTVALSGLFWSIFAALVTACATSPAGNAAPSSSVSASPSDPSTTTTSCSAVCDHIAECVSDADIETCMTNCTDLRATCRACLAESSCAVIEGGECDAVCGSLSDPPAKPTAPEGSSCTPVTFSAGSIGDGTKQGVLGEGCTLPADCLSKRCVTADLSDTTTQRWCGNQGDCKAPNNADEECPSGWQCVTVAAFPNADVKASLCVPANLDVCPPES
jgi:hypothetical protein